MKTIYITLIAIGLCALACGQTADGGWGKPDTVEQIEQKSQGCETYTQWQALDKTTYEAASIARLEEICAYSLKSCKPNITRYCTLGQKWLNAADRFEVKEADAAQMTDYLFAYTNLLASANQDQWSRRVRDDGAGVSDFLPLIRTEAGAKMARQQDMITAKIKATPEGGLQKTAHRAIHARR